MQGPADSSIELKSGAPSTSKIRFRTERATQDQEKKPNSADGNRTYLPDKSVTRRSRPVIYEIRKPHAMPTIPSMQPGAPGLAVD